MHPALSRPCCIGWRPALAGVVAVALLAPMPGVSRPAPSIRHGVPGSFVYCDRKPGPGPGLKVFAGEPTEDGALRFGLSLWATNGHHLGLWGVAAPRVDGTWEYEDGMDAETPDERCRLEITRSADGALHLASIDGAVCGGMRHGGAGMAIDELSFPPSSYAGPVTWQLDGPDPFFLHAGRCDTGTTS